MDRPLESAILLALIVTLLVWAIVRGGKLVRNGEWHATSGYRFRRFIAGRWEYRPMTDEERERDQEDRAW